MSSGGWGKKHAAELDEQTVLKWYVALLPFLSLLCLNMFLPSYFIVNNDFPREIECLNYFIMLTSINCF